MKYLPLLLLLVPLVRCEYRAMAKCGTPMGDDAIRFCPPRAEQSPKKDWCLPKVPGCPWSVKRG